MITGPPHKSHSAGLKERNGIMKGPCQRQSQANCLDEAAEAFESFDVLCGLHMQQKSCQSHELLPLRSWENMKTRRPFQMLTMRMGLQDPI